MKKNTGILLLIGFFILLFTPTKVFASTKQITCTYTYTKSEESGCGIQNVSFSYVVYDDKVEFDGFKNCPEPMKDGVCSLGRGGGKIGAGNILSKKFFEKVYDTDTGTYSCPSMVYSTDGFCNYVAEFGTGQTDTWIPLTVEQTNHSAAASKHMKICGYNRNVKGLGKVAITFYYEGPSSYSMTVAKDGGTPYNAQKSGGDLLTNIDGTSLIVSQSTLKKLYGDFNPDKPYTNAECSKKHIYLNNYNGDHYKIENKKGGTTSTEIKDENNTTTPNDPDYHPIVNADCKSLLGDELTGYLKQALSIIQIAGVIFAIILGMGDFINALLSGKSDDNGKAGHKFITRVIMAALLLLVPALLKFIINTFGLTEYGNSFCVI